MLNHIHLIAKNENMIGFIRDFKSYTSKELKDDIIATEPNILKLFEENGAFHFWQMTNMPEIIINEEFYFIKANYIENNPVRKHYVRNAEDWIYSSANKTDKLLVLENI